MMTNEIEPRASFLSTLQWLLAVTERYAENFNFALVKIAYGENNELGDAYGAQEARKQLESLSASLKKTFRKADLIARNGTDFWIIFPYTPFSENIYDKIRGVIDDGDHKELNIVNREITIFTSPFTFKDDSGQPLDALETLEHLKANQLQHAQHIFKISANEVA